MSDIKLDVPDLKVVVEKQRPYDIVLQEETYKTFIQSPTTYLISLSQADTTTIGLPLSAVFAISASYALTGSYSQNGFPYSGSAQIQGNLSVINSASGCVLFVTESGQVGINMCNPQYALHVSGAIFATDDVTAFSDRRVKTNIQPIFNALQTVSRLQGVTYTRLDRNDGREHIGFIAQDVGYVLPQVVVGTDEEGYGVSYGNITALLVEAIKELKTEVDELKLHAN